MIGARTAALYGRLLLGQSFDGELNEVPEPFGPILRSLNGLALEDRQRASADFLAGRPDAAEIAAAVAAASVEGPLPESDEPADVGEGLATTCLADIRPQPIRWLVPGFLPLGKLVILAGEGGNGKSTLTLHLAASVSQGWTCLGQAYNAPSPADVLLISCEDDFADTVVPRLMAAGADLGRVYRVDGVEMKDGRPGPFTLAHLDRMERELKRRPSVRLVVIDPVGGYVGRAGIDDNREAELRAVLDPMAELAAARSVLVVMVKHLSKDQTRKAAQRVGGSAAYVNAARAAFLVVPAPDDADRRLFLPIKFNIGPRPSGLSFHLEPLPEDERAFLLNGMDHLGAEDRQRLGNQLSRLIWDGTTDITADEALGADARRKPAAGSDPDKAAEWLRERLKDGPVGSILCAIEGNAAIGRQSHKFIMTDVKWWRVTVLNGRLGGKSRKVGKDDAVWFFTLPDGPWPPSEAAVEAARKAAEAARAEGSDGDSEESEGSEGTALGEPDGLGFLRLRAVGGPEESDPGDRDSSDPSSPSTTKNPPGSGGPDRDSSDPSSPSTTKNPPGSGGPDRDSSDPSSPSGLDPDRLW